MILEHHFVRPPHTNPFDNNNWTSYNIYPNLYYAHRDTVYTKETYSFAMQFHDYYELNIIDSGNISFLCEGRLFVPRHGDIVFIPPYKLHESFLISEQTRYIRYKFYFYPNALSDYNCNVLLSNLINLCGNDFFFTLERGKQEELIACLNQLDNALKLPKSDLDDCLVLSHIIQAFHLLSHVSSCNQCASSIVHETDEYLPQKLINIQNYIDEHAAEISSVSEIADHFFYSREYLSRAFRKYLNMTVEEYLLKTRISHSLQLMKNGYSITDSCFHSGFGSISNFYRAFRVQTGMSPSEYCASMKKNWST